MRLKEMNDPSRLHALDYTYLFSDEIARDYFYGLGAGYHTARSQQEKEKIKDAALTCALIYPHLVYMVYEADPRFRKAIDSNPELKRNFQEKKGWLDANGGRKCADDFIAQLVLDGAARGLV